MLLRRLSKKMQQDWDARGQRNAFAAIASGRDNWTESEFLESGQQAVQNFVLTDMENVCHGRDPKTMRVLEVGCGAGRVTRALADVFGEVHGIDVSGEMLREAKRLLSSTPNAYVYQNNGVDLGPVAHLKFDFAFSCLVFQHFPRKAVVKNYFSHVSNVLRPGALFKCQLMGDPIEAFPWATIKRVQKWLQRSDDTWTGVSLTLDEVRHIATSTGFETRYWDGAGTLYFWVWLFKPEEEQRSPGQCN